MQYAFCSFTLSHGLLIPCLLLVGLELSPFSSAQQPFHSAPHTTLTSTECHMLRFRVWWLINPGTLSSGLLMTPLLSCGVVLLSIAHPFFSSKRRMFCKSPASFYPFAVHCCVYRTQTTSREYFFSTHAEFWLYPIPLLLFTRTRPAVCFFTRTFHIHVGHIGRPYYLLSPISSKLA